MSYHDGPRIVTNGLVLYLDAGNSKSYPGNGTTWFDLSGNNKNATLTGATYNSSNNGKLVLDGINDYISIPSISSGSDGFSVGLWINSSLWNNTTNNCPCGGGTSALFSWATSCGYNFNMTYNKYLDNVVSYISNNGNVAIYQLYFNNVKGNSTNIWYYLVSTFGPSSNGFLRTYTNGAFNNSMSLANPAWGVNSAGGSFSINTGIQIGRELACCGNCWLMAHIGGLSVYNRRLSDSEVLQNYNALKGRFEL